MKTFRIGLAAAWVFLAAGASFAEDPKPDPAFGEWITLFDGKSLDGWEVSKPAKAKMNWTVEDGALTNDPTNPILRHNIATKRKFHNFEAELEFKIVKGGNSGVYMRGRAEIQILDSHGKETPDTNDMGALYKFKAPLVNAALPAGEWNKLYIRLFGTHCTAILNGKLVQNNTFIDHKTGLGRTDTFDSPGMFELQGDHEKVWFRNIRIRPLCEAEGWRPIFDGASTRGWKPSKQYGNPNAGGEMNWSVVDGELTNLQKHIHDIITEENFGDFLVRYEYRSIGNAGLFLRDLWEIQIENTFEKEMTKNTDGALYDFYPPKVNVSKPRGEWSVIESKVVGRKITVFQNGTLTHDNAECPARTYNKGNSKDMDAPGPFRLQGDHGGVWFTNLWVKPLK